MVARGLGRVHRHEQVPQSGSLGFGLEVFDGLQRRPALACCRVGGQFGGVLAFGRVDVVIHELEQFLLQFLGFGRVIEVHGFSLKNGGIGGA